MTGRSYRRLLAAFSLIFVASSFVRGQDVAVDRSVAVAPALPPLLYVPPDEAIGVLAPVRVPRHYPITPGPIGLPQLNRAAGIIFSGRVLSVGRVEGRDSSTFGPSAVSTTVTFQVEHALRGTSAGQTLIIHEWAALWTTGERYRVGERVLLFLYPPSRLGLTSPVAGPVGRFAMDPQGEILLNTQHIAALGADLRLGGKNIVSYANFVEAVRRSGGEK